MLNHIHSVIIYIILIINIIPKLIQAEDAPNYFCTGNRDPLTTEQLEDKYGQGKGLEYNDGKNCDRECDGKPKICFFRFVIENFYTMNANCGNCANNVTADCFNDECTCGNGVSRSVMAVNRKVPGPEIHVCQNDQVVVEVDNRLAGSTVTIHWHGLHQVETPFMDGVPMITQCPIFPGNKFRYVFKAREVGTHYWHAHTGLHRVDGIMGELVVREENDPNAEHYDIDISDHSMFMSDWINTLAEEWAPGAAAKQLNVDGLLINGHGCFTDSDTGDSNCAIMPIKVYYMQRGKRIRIRTDNGGAQLCAFEITVKNHNLTLIATDGFSVQPKTVGKIITLPGERYDFVISIPDDEKIALGKCANDGLQTFARIKYVDDQLDYTKDTSDYLPHPNPLDYDEPYDPDAIVFNELGVDCVPGEHLCTADLVNNVQSSVAGNLRNAVPDMEYYLNFTTVDVDFFPSTFATSGDKAHIGHINYVVSDDPAVPGLTQNDDSENYCNAENIAKQKSREGYYFCVHRVEVPLGSIVDFILNDISEPSAILCIKIFCFVLFLKRRMK